MLARATLATGFIAFTLGGIWIGSRAFLGTIVHLQDTIPEETYHLILVNYTALLEILVQVLRVIIALLSVLFVLTILKGNTMYRKWMALFNPMIILIVWALIGSANPGIGQHVLPVLMNITHFVLFSVSLYHQYAYHKHIPHA